MTDPQVFGRPSSRGTTGRSTRWPPDRTPTQTALVEPGHREPDAEPPMRIRFDWRFFAMAAVLAAILAALMFAFTAAAGDDGAPIAAPASETPASASTGTSSDT